MEERKWILGDDLAACDNLLDGITFKDVILSSLQLPRHQQGDRHEAVL